MTRTEHNNCSQFPPHYFMDYGAQSYGVLQPRVLTSGLSDPIRTVREIYVSAISFLVWDWFITLHQEVSLVWPRRYSLGKSLFLINRYFLFTILLIDTIFYMDPSLLPLCQQYRIFSDSMNTTATMVIQTILALRTYAMYRTKLCLYSLASLIITTGCVTVFLTAYIDLTDTDFLIFESVCLPICKGPLCSRFWYWVWGWHLGVDTIIVILSLYQYYQSWKLRRAISIEPQDFEISLRNQNSSFLRTLFHDGFFYYCVILCVAAINLIIVVIDYELTILAFVLSRSLQTVACSRLFLNLRRSLDKPAVDVGPESGFLSIHEGNSTPESAGMDRLDSARESMHDDYSMLRIAEEG